MERELTIVWQTVFFLDKLGKKPFPRRHWATVNSHVLFQVPTFCSSRDFIFISVQDWHKKVDNKDNKFESKPKLMDTKKQG